MLSVHNFVYANKADATITNVVLSECQLMIRMEGGGCGGGVVGEQKDELHEHVPSSENSLLKGGFHSSVHAHA